MFRRPSLLRCCSCTTRRGRFPSSSSHRRVVFFSSSSSSKANNINNNKAHPIIITSRVKRSSINNTNKKRWIHHQEEGPNNNRVDMSNNILPAIGNGAYIALMSGFLMTDMLSLRCMLVGGYTGLVIFHALHVHPLKIPLRWSAVFVLVNAGAALLLAYDQYCPFLSIDEQHIYEQHFQTTLTKGQFYTLIQMATFHNVPDNKILTLEGQCCPNLYFVLKGRAKVYHRKAFAAYIEEGGFVNDVAFQQQQQDGQEQEEGGAYGTVITVGDCSIIMWNTEELIQYLQIRPEMDRNMKYTLSKHLMKSLWKQREARHGDIGDNVDGDGGKGKNANNKGRSRNIINKLTDEEYREEIKGAEEYFGKRRITHRYGAPTYSRTNTTESRKGSK